MTVFGQISKFWDIKNMLSQKQYGRTHKDRWRVSHTAVTGTVGLIVLAIAKFASDGWRSKWQTKASQIGHLNTNVKYYEPENGHFFSSSLQAKGCWCNRYSAGTNNEIHNIERFKISCKEEVWEKSEDERGNDSNILGYSKDHSRWFYAASYDGDCSRYKLLLTAP
jgi:hypothetical protein